MEEKLLKDFKQEFETVKSTSDIDALKTKWLGKKGPISAMGSNMANLSNDERRELGKNINMLKQSISKQIAEKQDEIREAELNEKLNSEKVDVTLTTHVLNEGTSHPLSIILEKATNFFKKLGYLDDSGNEVETDEYNFERLNLDKDHPARDMQDSFFIDESVLLRTHCTSVTSRAIEKIKEAPIRVLAHGPVYRRDDDDATHSHQFMQIDGVNIDKNISIANLKWTLLEFAKEMFGEEAKIRLRPSYFPFTEPSFEVDVTCIKCGGKGCSICKNTGWIEILGAGMLHPNVIKMNGLDPKTHQGFAFGIGVERIAMLKYGVEDIRRFYTNDIRFLEQFKKT